jgi:formylglycine-generating enzyme required for sulfatase activity
LLLALTALSHVGLAEPEKGRRLALVVGVNKYDGDFTNLAYAVNDADELAKVLRSKCAFDGVTLLTDRTAKKPTAANIREALSALLKRATRRDTVLVALAGHGVQLEVKDRKGEGDPKRYTFFCPSDADLSDVKYNTGASDTMINLDELFEKLGRSRPGIKLVLMDACRNELKAKGRTRRLSEDRVEVPDGVQALLSCGRRQVAYELDALKHGLFFHHVIEGLKGKARNDEGDVTWASLTGYATREVTRGARKMSREQTPATAGYFEGETPLLAKSSGEKTDLPPREKGWAKEVKNSVGMKLVRIPAGDFMMGANGDDSDAKDEEKPRHKVIISKEFWLGVTEVTQKQFKKVMGYNPSFFSKDGKKRDADTKYVGLPGEGKDKVKGLDTDDFPVENVSWDEAVEFCEKLSKMEKKDGRLYRLPTEAEWEYACRGGARSYKKFNVGDELTKDDANFYFSLDRTCRADFGKKNGFELYGMHGNVCEWCADTRREYEGKAVTDPRGPEKEGSRVVRGGCWFQHPMFCRSAYRPSILTASRSSYFGFRVALVPVR